MMPTPHCVHQSQKRGSNEHDMTAPPAALAALLSQLPRDAQRVLARAQARARSEAMDACSLYMPPLAPPGVYFVIVSKAHTYGLYTARPLAGGGAYAVKHTSDHDFLDSTAGATGTYTVTVARAVDGAMRPVYVLSRRLGVSGRNSDLSELLTTALSRCPSPV